MSWEIDFEARPFKLAVRRASAGPGQRAVAFSPFALPDSLYRAAARRVLGRLARENWLLRQKHHHRPSRMTAGLASLIERWSQHRWRALMPLESRRGEKRVLLEALTEACENAAEMVNAGSPELAREWAVAAQAAAEALAVIRAKRL